MAREAGVVLQKLLTADEWRKKGRDGGDTLRGVVEAAWSICHGHPYRPCLPYSHSFTAPMVVHTAHAFHAPIPPTVPRPLHAPMSTTAPRPSWPVQPRLSVAPMLDVRCARRPGVPPHIARWPRRWGRNLRECQDVGTAAGK